MVLSGNIWFITLNPLFYWKNTYNRTVIDSSTNQNNNITKHSLSYFQTQGR